MTTKQEPHTESQQESASPTRDKAVVASVTGAGTVDLFATGVSASTDARQDAPTVRLTLGALVKERYLVGDQLGEGGMGIVYRVFDQLRGRDVALKLFRAGLTQSAQHSLREEIRLNELLQHDGIVRTFELDFLPETGQLFFTMELIEGEPIQTHLERAHRKGTLPPLPKALLKRIVTQLVEVLAYAHKKDVIHCDLKPHNVLLTPEGDVKLLDFGLARVLSEEVPSDAFGSAVYMAPEQLRAGETLTHATDVYALGVLCYQLLTGELFYGRMPGPYTWYREKMLTPFFGPKMDEVLLQAMEASVEARTPSIEAFAQGFFAALEDHSDAPSVSTQAREHDPTGEAPPQNATHAPSATTSKESARMNAQEAGIFELTGPDIDDEALEDLRSHADDVIVLRLWGAQLNDRSLRKLRHFTKLESLNLWDTQIGDAGLLHLLPLSQLRELFVGFTQIGDASLEVLKKLPSLEVLDLRRTQITDKGLKNLTKLSLRSLNLRDTHIGDKAAGIVSKINSLQELNVRNTRITDKGIKSLSRLKQLHKLDLRATQVSDAGHKALRRLSALRSLYLTQEHFSETFISRLEQELPQCEIVLSPHPT